MVFNSRLQEPSEEINMIHFDNSECQSEDIRGTNDNMNLSSQQIKPKKKNQDRLENSSFLDIDNNKDDSECTSSFDEV